MDATAAVLKLLYCLESREKSAVSCQICDLNIDPRSQTPWETVQAFSVSLVSGEREGKYKQTASETSTTSLLKRWTGPML